MPQSRKNNYSIELIEFKALVSGVLADDILVLPEIKLLLHWLENHSSILDIEPFSKYFELMSNIDGEMDTDGISALKKELYLFLGKEASTSAKDNNLPISNQITELNKSGRFCLVGKFEIVSKSKIISMIEESNGIVNEAIRIDTNYFVVGKLHSDWANSPDAEKIEQAISYKEMGSGLEFVTEEKFLEIW